MSIEITNKKSNELLSRLELEGKITFEGKPTPSNEQAKKMIADSLSTEQSNVAVKKIKTNYGSNSAVFRAYSYSNSEVMARIERKPKVAKAAAAEGGANEENAEAPKKEVAK
ncbi:hypothetical protein J4401_07265 [Candidatus Woesearchaeota archaeon]|nr:hypothetical protein [Candidatus Woesearchaeota archaeon]